MRAERTKKHTEQPVLNYSDLMREAFRRAREDMANDPALVLAYGSTELIKEKLDKDGWEWFGFNSNQ